MRVPAWFTAAAVALAMTLIAAGRADAQSKCPDDWPGKGLNLSGRLADGDIRAFLDIGYPAASADAVSGVFFYPAQWQPGAPDFIAAFTFEGTVAADCQMQLEDSDGGLWHLKIAGRRVVGTRADRAGVSRPVSLQIVPATDCSGRGPWRSFSSPRWPITFSYPASWRLAEEGDHIVLQCPDAASMAWGGAPIWFQRGQGREAVVARDGRKASRIDAFLTFGDDRWLVGETCDERAADDLGVFCTVARQSVWRGMTVLQGAAGEHRLYRAGGGYVGQGGGIMAYAFLLGETWVAVQSHDTPASYDDLGSPGPVLFHGDGVTERLVRSIKVRSQPAGTTRRKSL
jgi:hypothetical protein